jgi:two-component sensor histidine kinase
MYEDARGVLWIATQNGVERFLDGKIEILSTAGMISGDITTPFAEDGLGGMFFVTSSGLFHWEDGVVRRFPLRLRRQSFPWRSIAILSCEYGRDNDRRRATRSWQLEATAKLFRDSDSESTPAAKSRELARSMVSHCQAEARRIIWDLRDTEEVTNILSQALSRTLATNHMQDIISTTLDVEGDEVPLAPGCVHHLVCIGQEAVSNAIRHAHPSYITIHLKYESEALNLSIRDDGQGFYASDRTTARRGHFGIPVMEERARKLGGTLRLQTSAGVGTEVTVRVPFNTMQQSVSQEPHVIRWIGI